MPTTANIAYSNAKLEPVYDADLARQRSVNWKPSVTIAKGTIVGELLGTDAQQTLTFANATGGTFTLTWGGHTTGNITYSATLATLAANIKAALVALTGIGAGNVSVAATSGPVATVTFIGALGAQPISAITADATNLTSGSTATITVAATAVVGVTVTPGTFAAYSSTATDGTQYPKGLAVYDITTDADGNVWATDASGQQAPLAGGGFGLTAPMYVSGVFATSALTGLDANAVTALLARFETGNLSDGGIIRF